MSRELEPTLGEIQKLTPTIDALYVPEIDESLDAEEPKREFWARLPRARRLVRRPAAVLGAPASRSTVTDSALRPALELQHAGAAARRRRRRR